MRQKRKIPHCNDYTQGTEAGASSGNGAVRPEGHPMGRSQLVTL